MKRLFNCISKFFLNHYYISMIVTMLLISVCAILGICYHRRELVALLLFGIAMMMFLIAANNFWHYKKGYSVSLFVDRLRDYLEQKDRLDEYEKIRGNRAIVSLFIGMVLLLTGLICLLFEI